MTSIDATSDLRLHQIRRTRVWPGAECVGTEHGAGE
jgi:hypothetical protein